ncbi:MAG: ATP-binding cassette domain-containing protein, partial [Nitrososphaerales archaeon]
MKHTQVQMKGETVIELQGVKKVYPDQILAIDDISFKLERGKTLALVGPSGCGKSTTLKMINRLVEPTAGRILVEGRDVGKEDPVKLRRSIGYVIQEVGLFPHLTVEGNISLLPKLEGWSKVEIRNRVRYLLEKVRLKPDIFARRFPKELSGGQSQRVGVARALALNPSILLMDEPFGALDPIIRAELQEEFLAILQEFEKTIIFVTHDLNEALKMGDVIAIMNEGKIVQLDTPKNLLKHPIDTFVSD